MNHKTLTKRTAITWGFMCAMNAIKEISIPNPDYVELALSSAATMVLLLITFNLVLGLWHIAKRSIMSVLAKRKAAKQHNYEQFARDYCDRNNI